MRTIPFTLLCAAATILAGCATSTATPGEATADDETTISRTFAADAFDRVIVNCSADIRFTQRAGAPAVTAHGTEKAVDQLEVSVEEGTLRIGCRNAVKRFSTFDVTFDIAAESLAGIKVNGSGDIALGQDLTTANLRAVINGSGELRVGRLRCDTLSIFVNGSGDVRLDSLDCAATEIYVNGSGDITAAGATGAAEYRINGAGDMKLDNLVADDVTARINGAGNIRCHARNTLVGKVSGAGTIRYKGSPAVTNRSRRESSIKPL